MQLRANVDTSAVRRNRSYGSEEWVAAETHFNWLNTEFNQFVFCEDWQAVVAGNGSRLNKHVSPRKRNAVALREGGGGGGHECAENCKNSIGLPYANCQFVDAETIAECLPRALVEKSTNNSLA